MWNDFKYMHKIGIERSSEIWIHFIFPKINFEFGFQTHLMRILCWQCDWYAVNDSPCIWLQIRHLLCWTNENNFLSLIDGTALEGIWNTTNKPCLWAIHNNRVKWTLQTCWSFTRTILVTNGIVWMFNLNPGDTETHKRDTTLQLQGLSGSIP